MDHRTILTEAARVLGERGALYGGVEESFTRAAAIAALKLNKAVSAYDVAIILESVKDARRATAPGHYDSHLDGINYRAFAAEFAMAEWERRQEPAPSRGAEVEAGLRREVPGFKAPTSATLRQAMEAVDREINPR